MDKHTSRGLDFDYRVIFKPFATYFSSGFKFLASSPNLMALLSLNTILFIDQHLIATRPYLIGLQLTIGASFRKSVFGFTWQDNTNSCQAPIQFSFYRKNYSIWARPREDSIRHKFLQYAPMTLQFAVTTQWHSPIRMPILILTLHLNQSLSLWQYRSCNTGPTEYPTTSRSHVCRPRLDGSKNVVHQFYAPILNSNHLTLFTFITWNNMLAL